MLNEEQKLDLEINGYTIIRNALSPEEIVELNAVSDKKIVASTQAKDQQREFFICKWGKPFLELVSHEKTLPYINHLCGPKFRLDHDYCIFMNPGSPAGRLHGGEKEYTDFWYKREGDKIQSGLTVAMFFLNDVNEGEGGFVAIPGSHRGNFLTDLPEDLLYQKNYQNHLTQPTFKAGDAVIFMEGLIHGTGAWKGEGQRRVLLYKYCPGHMSWGGDFYDPNDFDELTEVQKNIMRPPYIEMIKPPNGKYRSDTLISE